MVSNSLQIYWIGEKYHHMKFVLSNVIYLRRYGMIGENMVTNYTRLIDHVGLIVAALLGFIS